jgi:hypothetical protein
MVGTYSETNKTRTKRFLASNFFSFGTYNQGFALPLHSPHPQARETDTHTEEGKKKEEEEGGGS